MRVLTLLFSITAMLCSAEIQGKMLSGISAGSSDGARAIIDAGGWRYIVKTSAAGILLERRSFVAADGKTTTEELEGMVVTADGAQITSAAGIAAGAPVQVVIGKVVSVWMFPTVGADGNPTPGGWRSSVVANALPGTPAIQGQAPSELEITGGAFANGHLLADLDLQAGRSADVIIVADIEPLAGSKQKAYKGLRFSGTASQSKIGDRIVIKLSKVVYVASDGKTIEATAEGYICDSHDGLSGVITGAKTLPEQNNAAAVINTIGPAIRVSADQKFTVVISSPIKV